MTDDEMARKAPDTSFEIVIAHGVAKGGIGFEWQNSFIHNPLAALFAGVA